MIDKKIKHTLYIFASLITLVSIEVMYLSATQSLDDETMLQKKTFTELVGLPDLAFSTENFVRHRSLSSVFDIYSEDGVLREYEKSTFLYPPRSIKGKE